MTATALALALLVGCIGGGAGIDLPYFDVVYECTVAAPGRSVVELCFDQGADELELQLAETYGGTARCEPTQRHAGPCIYSCEPHAGCNAYQGCWCQP